MEKSPERDCINNLKEDAIHSSAVSNIKISQLDDRKLATVSAINHLVELPIKIKNMICLNSSSYLFHGCII